jgi:hypothetical protein
LDRVDDDEAARVGVLLIGIEWDRVVDRDDTGFDANIDEG